MSDSNEDDHDEEQPPTSFEDLRTRVERVAGGRQVILKFKPGGRIKEEHIYDSANIADVEASMAFQFISSFATVDGPDGKKRPEFSPAIIGKRWMGLAPWDIPNFQNLLATATESDRFTFSCPFSVADVIEQPKTVIVEIEAV